MNNITNKTVAVLAAVLLVATAGIAMSADVAADGFRDSPNDDDGNDQTSDPGDSSGSDGSTDSDSDTDSGDTDSGSDGTDTEDSDSDSSGDSGSDGSTDSEGDDTSSDDGFRDSPNNDDGNDQTSDDDSSEDDSSDDSFADSPNDNQDGFRDSPNNDDGGTDDESAGDGFRDSPNDEEDGFRDSPNNDDGGTPPEPTVSISGCSSYEEFSDFYLTAEVDTDGDQVTSYSWSPDLSPTSGGVYSNTQDEQTAQVQIKDSDLDVEVTVEFEQTNSITQACTIEADEPSGTGGGGSGGGSGGGDDDDGDDGGGDDDEDSNSDPTASFTFDPTNPEEGDTVSFDASGSSDSDGSIDTYSWDFDADGNYEATGLTVTETFDSAGDYDITLRVVDNDGATDTETDTLTISDPSSGNQPPNSDAGPDQTVEEGDTVTLDGSGTTDSDSSIITYEWRQLSGRAVSIQNEQSVDPEFTAPSVSNTATLEFELEAEDGEGNTDTDTVSITVEPEDTGGGGGDDDDDSDGDTGGGGGSGGSTGGGSISIDNPRQLSAQLSSNEVNVGEAVTVSGYAPQNNVEVNVNLDGTRVGQTTSGGDGYYSVTFTPNTAGQFNLVVRSEGESKNFDLLVNGDLSINSIRAPENVASGEIFEVCADVESGSTPTVRLFEDGESVSFTEQKGEVCFERMHQANGTYDYTVVATTGDLRAEASTSVTVGQSTVGPRPPSGGQNVTGGFMSSMSGPLGKALFSIITGLLIVAGVMYREGYRFSTFLG